MKLLIDTHALIWYVDQDHLVSKTGYDAIADPDNELLLSAASIWEIAIKVGLTKLALSSSYRDWMSRAITDLEVAILPITLDYADMQSTLPHFHRDPFDRMLIAQAQVEQIPIVSGDSILDQYNVTRIW